MKKTRRHLLGLGAGLFAWRAALGQDAPLEGTWTGTLNVGSQRLRVRFVIQPDGTGVLYSLDQGGEAIAAKRVDKPAPEVRIDVPSLRGHFTGRFTAADRIEGAWKQLITSTPLVLLRGEAGLAAPVRDWQPLTPEALEQLRREVRAPALAAACSREAQRQLWVTGKRREDTDVRATTDDLWHLGSITKSMTATLVARLVDAGIVTFEDTVEQHLGEIAPNMQSAYRGVTFRHLLSHRSGIPGALSTLRFSSFLLRGDRNLREQRRDWARSALAMKPLGPVQKTYQYSNNGYVVAGAMLEAALDMTWEELMRRQLFEPLGLRSAGFGAPRGEQPWGHAEEGNAKLAELLGANGLKPVAPGDAGSDNPPALGPAGTVHMNLADTLTYLAAHRDRTGLLAADTWRTLHTPPDGGDYALGWTVRPDGSLWHNGSNTRWYAEVAFDPNSRTSAVAVTNEARWRAQEAVGTALMRALAASAPAR